MAGRAPKSKAKAKPTSGSAAPGKPGVPHAQVTRGRREIAGGVGLIVLGVAMTALLSGGLRYALSYGPVIAGIFAVAVGASRLAPSEPLSPLADPRRWIYGGLDVLFAVVYAIVIWKVIPNRLPSAAFHLWTMPVLGLVMGLGTLAGGRVGWWTAIVSGSLLLGSVIVLIMRILISAAFLAGVYGAFGKAAASFAVVAIALIVEVVALLPIIQIKFLMSRAGRRACARA